MLIYMTVEPQTILFQWFHAAVRVRALKTGTADVAAPLHALHPPTCAAAACTGCARGMRCSAVRCAGTVAQCTALYTGSTLHPAASCCMCPIRRCEPGSQRPQHSATGPPAHGSHADSAESRVFIKRVQARVCTRLHFCPVNRSSTQRGHRYMHMVARAKPECCLCGRSGRARSQQRRLSHARGLLRRAALAGEVGDAGRDVRRLQGRGEDLARAHGREVVQGLVQGRLGVSGQLGLGLLVLGLARAWRGRGVGWGCVV